MNKKAFKVLLISMMTQSIKDMKKRVSERFDTVGYDPDIHVEYELFEANIKNLINWICKV